MSKILYTSDSHLGHSRIIEYCNRPFKDADTMDFEIIQRWNEVVMDDDIVYHLGDFALCENWRKANILASLNGIKILILGNHDYFPRDRYKLPSKDGKKQWNTELARHDYINLGFYEVYDELELEHNGYKLTHHPQEAKGRFLCGHVHNKWAISDLRPHGALNINVGVDINDYKPVTIEQALENAKKWKKK